MKLEKAALSTSASCARKSARREPLEQDRISTRRAGGLDSAIGRVLGQVKHLRAVGEQRGLAFSEIKTSCIELGE